MKTQRDIARLNNSASLDAHPASSGAVLRETLLTFLWKNNGDANLAINAMETGSLELTGNFKGLEIEIAKQARNHSNERTERQPTVHAGEPIKNRNSDDHDHALIS